MLSFAALDRETARVAAFLGARGVGPGDRVVAQVEKSARAVVLYLACLRAGVVYVCPAGRYAEITETRRIALTTGPVPVGGHCPNGDRLLASIARVYGKDAVGVVLTGMGADGAEGLLTLRDAQGMTFAQDEETSVIYGMPCVALRKGGVKRVLPLQDIANAIAKAIT